jgi:acetyltransferase-like isoleucine patch superfamily enzyme
VEIGLYTHGGCFNPGNFDRYTKVGSFCSIAKTAYVMNRNHPMDFKSSHAFFFNPELGLVAEDRIAYTPLVIGHDVWLGHNAIIMPNVTEIGNGAVVAAGAVVSKNVPPYAVVVGNPARVVRYRFSEESIDALMDSHWWELDIEDIVPIIDEFTSVHEESEDV